MKPKFLLPLLVPLSVMLTSCSDQNDDLNTTDSYVSVSTNLNKKDSIANTASHPADPPIKGTDWKIKKTFK